MGTSDDRGGSGPASDAPLRALFELLTTRSAEIESRWVAAVRRALGPDATGEPVDPIPDLIERISALGPQGSDPSLTATEVLERAGRGGEDVVAAVTRVALLRDAVMEEWESLPRGGATALRFLNQALDRAALEAVIRSAAERERTGRAIDRLAEAAREGQGPDALLRIILEESTVIDGAAVLLREGECFRVRAAVGVELPRRDRLVPVGQGFPALVGAAAAPVLARWGRDPLGPDGGAACAVYGVPLAAGVAYLVSLTAQDFPPDDRRLFRVALEHVLASTGRELRAGADDRDWLLAEAREGLESRDRAVAHFVHDIRTPLGVVLMQAGALVLGGGNEDGARLAKRAATLQRASLRMERLLEDCLSFHEVRAGDLPLILGPVEPVELVRKSLESFRAAAEERRVALEAELSPGLPAVIGDAERLAEVFAHLVRAALQGIAEGGRIVLRAQHDDGGVVFSVEDSGPHLEPEGPGDLFDCAWRGERLGPGRSGLGLAVAKAIVERHGGRIWAAASEGNTHCFALPAARA